ncbi:alpha/beta fold hydrolase [Bacillus sp. B15-48]|nr:alpha/beta fold hydrolase [Bacillus sp. B15-48]
MHRIHYGKDKNQFGDLRVPEGKGPFPVAILIHGGFWKEKSSLDQMNKIAESLTRKGIATWNIEYRRVGQEGGGWPGTLQDNVQAADYVRTISKTYPLNLDRIITIGHSAGGQLSLWLAGRHQLPASSILRTPNPLRVKGAISLAGVCDLSLMYEVHQLKELMTGVKDNPTKDLIGGTPKGFQERYDECSPIKLLPIGVPQILVHGALDINVPIGISEKYKNYATDSGDIVTLKKIDSAEHFKIIDPDSKEWSMFVDDILSLISSVG